MVEEQVQPKVTKNPVKAKVVSVSKDLKTAKVQIDTVVAHAKYTKRMHRISTMQVDTAGKPVQVGGLVTILPCRRISKTKSWKVVEVLKF